MALRIEGVVTHRPEWPDRWVIETSGRHYPLHAGDPIALWHNGQWWPGRVELTGAEWVWVGRIGPARRTVPLADGMRVRER